MPETSERQVLRFRHAVLIITGRSALGIARLGIWIALSCAAAAVVVGSLSFHPEPRYKGRSLTEWLSLSRPQMTDGFGYPELTPAAVDAVRHIGTNGIPFYLRWIRWEPSPYERIGWMPAQLKELLDSMTASGAKWARGNDAVIGFRTLGPQAAAAILALAGMMLERKNGYPVGFRARFALAYLGKDALAPLLGVLTNAPSWDQINIAMAVAGMSYLGTNARPAVPILVQSTTNSITAVEAARALGCFAMEPAISIPALTNCLQSSNWECRVWAVWSLGQFGGEARGAAPLLAQSLLDSRREVRQNAYAALKKTAPDWFPKEHQAGYPMDKAIEDFLQSRTNLEIQ
jgi:hypothetical protein